MAILHGIKRETSLLAESMCHINKHIQLINIPRVSGSGYEIANAFVIRCF